MVQILFQLVHAVPPLVGLLLVLRVRSDRPWRLWAILYFGLAVLVVVLSAGFTFALSYGGWRLGGFGTATFTLVQLGLSTVSFLVACLGVVAVVSGRRDEERPAPPATSSAAPYPASQPRG